ncbi:MAG: hypothetical protein K0R43_411 [Pseudoduganella sp.]|jgi:tetratricopeptide (TPR) repeat protein|nr:hypothetical protein [Pseudoduganella sp.]
MTDFYNNLTAQEFKHLALAAIGRSDLHTSISCLKHALAQDGSDAECHLLLGAQYAQIGMADAGLAALRRAVELNPGLEMAHFQLGLLYLTQGQVAEAALAWQAFDASDSLHPLRLFRDGMLCLVRDEFDDAKRLLLEGMARNVVNQSLNRDMENVLRRIEAAQAELAPPEAPAAAGEQHLAVSAYQPE